MEDFEPSGFFLGAWRQSWIKRRKAEALPTWFYLIWHQNLLLPPFPCLEEDFFFFQMYTATNHSFQFKCQIKSRQTLPCSTLPPALGWALWPFPKPPIAWHSPKPSPRGHLQPQLPIPSARCPVSTLPIKETKDIFAQGGSLSSC